MPSYKGKIKCTGIPKSPEVSFEINSSGKITFSKFDTDLPASNIDSLAQLTKTIRESIKLLKLIPGLQVYEIKEK